MKTFLVIAIAAGGLAWWVQDQQEKSEERRQGMVDMMDECRDNCAASLDAMEEARTLLREAREAADWKLVEDADRKLEEIQRRMKTCSGNMRACCDMLHGPRP